MLVTGIIFLVWDRIFSDAGIWGFNPDYLTGYDIAGLPVEECLFFLTIPYASVFTYEVYRYYFGTGIPEKFTRQISAILVFLLIISAALFHKRLYTLVTFLSLGMMVILVQFVLRTGYMGRFYMSYLIILLPFALVNGILTGTGIGEEVVWYNHAEIIGLRILTIPLEDIFYGMLLLLMNITLYEYLLRKW